MEYQQTQEDLKNQFKAQIRFLEKSCQEYDNGDLDEAKRIAIGLRILFHDTRNSKSLLSQLNIPNDLFLSATGLYTPSNLLPSYSLCDIEIHNNEIRFLPKLTDINGRVFYLLKQDWWNEIVFDDKNSFLSRSDIVLNVANTDGGAHVDPILKNIYADIAHKHSLTRNIFFNGDKIKPRNNPAYAAIRQIGHEVLTSMNLDVSNFKRVEYPNHSFEMRFVDDFRRFKWSRTEIEYSEETAEIINKFRKERRTYLVFKPKGEVSKPFEAVVEEKLEQSN